MSKKTTKTKKTTTKIISKEAIFFNRKDDGKKSGNISFSEINGETYAVCEDKLYIHCNKIGAILYAASNGCQCFITDDYVFLLASDAIDLTNKRDKTLGADTTSKLTAIATLLNATI